MRVKFVVALLLISCCILPVSAAEGEVQVLTPDLYQALVDGESTMADVIVEVLGEYQPRTYTVDVLDADGNVIATSVQYVDGLAGLDVPWIAGAILFGLFFLGCFRLLGGAIRS